MSKLMLEDIERALNDKLAKHGTVVVEPTGDFRVTLNDIEWEYDADLLNGDPSTVVAIIADRIRRTLPKRYGKLVAFFFIMI